jgi:hypothetical protein
LRIDDKQSSYTDEPQAGPLSRVTVISLRLLRRPFPRQEKVPKADTNSEKKK